MIICYSLLYFLSTDLLVLQKVFLELWVFFDVDLLQRFQALFAIRQSVVLIFFFLLIFPILYVFFLPLFTTPLPFPVDGVIAALHGVEHASDLFPVFAEEFVLFDLVFGYEVKSIVATDSKVVLYFFTIFAAVDMEDKFFASKDVILVEWASCFFFILALSKHVLNYNCLFE